MVKKERRTAQRRRVGEMNGRTKRIHTDKLSRRMTGWMDEWKKRRKEGRNGPKEEGVGRREKREKRRCLREGVTGIMEE